MILHDTTSWGYCIPSAGDIAFYFHGDIFYYSWGYCIPSWGYCIPSWGYCIPSWGYCIPSWGYCIPSWGYCIPVSAILLIGRFGSISLA